MSDRYVLNISLIEVNDGNLSDLM